jgi:hypothetical protein
LDSTPQYAYLKERERETEKKMKVPNWKIIVQDRTKWKGVVEKTKTVREL